MLQATGRPPVLSSPGKLAGWPVLLSACLGAALCFVNASALSVALPLVARSLEATPAQASWILLSYMLVSTICILSFGRLADIWGRRRLYLAGLAIFVLASAGCAWSATAPVLLMFRVLQAVGAAAVFANTSALVSDAFGSGRLGLALGILAMVAALAQVLGPLIGGAVAAEWGWRAIFLLNVPVGVGALVWSWCALPSMSTPSVERFDGMGALLSFAGLGGVVYALSMGGPHGWLSPGVCIGAVVGAVALAAFAVTQMTRTQPLVDPGLFADPSRAVAYVCVLLLSVTQAAPVVLVALFMQVAGGLDSLGAGIRIAPVALGMLFAAPVAGALTRRIAAEHLCTAGMLLAACGLAGLTFFLSPDVDATKLGASLLLFGVGIGIFVTPNNTAILRSVGTERRGIANGVRSTLQNAGFVIGTALTLSIATAPLPPSAQRAAYGGSLGHLSAADLASLTQGCQRALGTLSACCALGVLLSLAMQRRNRAVR